MNPITETSYGLVRYVVLWCLFAAAYAAAFAGLASMPLEVAAADGAAFGAVSGFAGLILWNVLRYGMAGIGVPLMKAVYLTVVGLLFVAVSVGAEVAAVWAAAPAKDLVPGPEAPGVLPAFATTIPARVLSVAAVYVCFVLWYRGAAISEEAAADTPAGKQTGEVRDPVERITVKGAGGRIEVIGIEEIIYLRAEGDYVAIVTAGGRRLKESTMKYFEEVLPRDRFVRVHRSCIVAVGHISRIETSGREHTLVLHRGDGNTRSEESVRISDTGYRLLKQTLGL